MNKGFEKKHLIFENYFIENKTLVKKAPQIEKEVH